MLPDYFEFTLPTKTIYGIGITDSLSSELKPYKKTRALLVTDNILVQAGPVDKVREGVSNAGIETSPTGSWRPKPS